MLPNFDVNTFSVLVAAVVSMIVGSFWYSPILFGNQWMKLMNFSKKDIAKAKKKGMGKPYLIAIVTSIIMAYILAYFSGIGSAVGVVEGMKVGLLMWLGFSFPLLVSGVLWENKPFRLFLLNAGYWLVTLVVMGAVLGSWT